MSSVYAIEVVGGADDGARLVVDRQVRTVGRARGVDLVLSDPTVSRRHLQVTAAEGGVAFVVCGDATPFVVDDMPGTQLEAGPGKRLVVGNTTLAIVVVNQSAPVHGEAWQTDVRTLLTGVAEDTRAMAAVHALVEELDAAGDRASLDAAFVRWAMAHARAIDVAIDAVAAGAPPEPEVAVRPDGSDVTTVSVPAPGREALRLTLRCAIPIARVGPSFRRMSVVAGRVFGSATVRLHRVEAYEAELSSLRALSFGSARAFLGDSAAARRVAALVPRLAASDVPVLLIGETGVGKTFVARLIHEAGPRRAGPLRVVNCAAIPESLAEAELFGHERGAFTGAIAAREGAFEAAGTGTLVLDEIGELPLGVQSKLLHVLEEKRFTRVGSNRPLDVRARIVCATNRDLEEMIAAKTFRSDLYFRVSVVRLQIPALRQRGEDLELLAQQMLADAARLSGRRVTGFSAEALDAIRRYPWPGNVRELRNAIEHAVALGEGAVVVPADLPIGERARALQPDDANLVRLPLDLATLEKQAIDAALRHTDGNRTKAAALLGITRQTLHNKLAEPKA